MHFAHLSLSNLSRCLSNLDRWEDALLAVEEAVRILRPLAANYPTVFRPPLARSLTALSGIFSYLGRMPEVIQAVGDAVRLLRPLAMERAAVFSRELAKSLAMLSHYYSDTGRHEDALRTALTNRCAQYGARVAMCIACAYFAALRIPPSPSMTR